MAVAHAHPGTGCRAALDELIGAWLPVLAAAGRRLEHPLTAIATNGKRLRGAGDGAGRAVRRAAARKEGDDRPGQGLLGPSQA